MDDLDFLENESFEEKTLKKRKNAYVRMHETANGRVIPLLAMEDNHIISTIKLFLRIAIEAKKNALYSVNDTIDMFHHQLNGFKPITKDEAIERISSIMYRLEPYIMEMFIRGNFEELKKLHLEVAELLGRKNVILKQNSEEQDNELLES